MAPDARAVAVRRHEVLALSLFVVLVAAKVAVLAGRPLPSSRWAPVAFIWQDVAVALGFLLFARLARQEWAVRLIYGALVVLAAINVPVVRALSSPLTSSMLRAARGTLGESILHYATPANVALIFVVLALGALLPRVLRTAFGAPRVWLAGAVALVVLGSTGGRRVDTAGLERNVVTALARTSLPRMRPSASDADWRRPAALPAVVGQPHPDLSSLRQAAAGMNLLLVVLESTGAQYLKTYGAAEDPTPNLSLLAERSLVFDNAYAVYPESIKGLIVYLASRYPGFDVAAEAHAAIASPSLASVLATRGYETALFHSGRFFYLGMEEILARSGFARLDDAGAIGGNRKSSFGIDETAAVRHVLRWLDSLPRAKPFFAAYLPIAGHHPYAYAEIGPFPEETEVDRYRNALHEGDRALGELLAGLRTRGLDRSTVVIVIGDHAEAFGQHPGNYGHTLAIWDENVRVPLVISVPGADRNGSRVSWTASLIDVPPTALDILGVEPPASFQGSSLLDGEERVALFYTDYSLGLLGLRDGCMKYIHELESGRSRLFDMCADPGERTNIAARHPEQVAAYRERVRGWSAAQVARVRAANENR
jgi:arylsulfatase A-like enzyme